MPGTVEAEGDEQQDDGEQGGHMPSQEAEMSCDANGDKGQEGREAKDAEQREAAPSQPAEECFVRYLEGRPAPIAGAA